MPTFTYTAATRDGKNESGTIEAVDTMAAGHLLKEQGLMPLDLSEKHERGFSHFMASMSTVSLKQKIAFIEDLHVMLKAGIAAPRSMKILAKQTKNKKFQMVLVDLAAQVEAGKSLHEAMALYPKIFSNIFVSMIKVGEISGNLEQSLQYLSIQLERDADMKSKTRGAMIYPAVIVGAMVIIGIVLAIFVLPKLTGIFKEFNTNLPLMTRIVIVISDFMGGHAFLIMGGTIGIVVGGTWFLRTKVGGIALDWFVLHFPIIGGIVKKINLARFARIMSSLMKSGISIIEGLAVTAQAIDNSYYRAALADAAEQVKLGKPLTETMARNPQLFPFLITQMLEVGEETGSLEDIMLQIAEHFESDVDNVMRNFSSVIEPLLLLFIGTIVGILALALIMPIYNISNSIN